MQSFKSFLLKENNNSEFAPWHIRDKKQIQQIFKQTVANKVSNFKILKDGSLDIIGGDHFYWNTDQANRANLDVTKLPFKFGKCSSIEYIMHLGEVEDIWGAPTECNDLYIKAPKLKTLQHLNGKYGYLSLFCQELTEFKCHVECEYIFMDIIKKFDAKDFSKSFKSSIAEEYLSLTFSKRGIEVLYKTPLLSLLTNEDFGNISFNSMRTTDLNEKTKQLAQVCDIINKHKDILDCQEELIANGFQEYAKL